MKRILTSKEIASLIASILEHQASDGLEIDSSYRFVLRFRLHDEYLDVKSAEIFKIKEDTQDEQNNSLQNN